MNFGFQIVQQSAIRNSQSEILYFELLILSINSTGISSR